MQFTWDDAKNDQCLSERGFSFADVTSAFADPESHVEVDDRWDYGEARRRLYGRVAGRLFVIVYTLRGDVVRIISARKANARERRRHGKGSDQGRRHGRRDSAGRI